MKPPHDKNSGKRNDGGSHGRGGPRGPDRGAPDRGAPDRGGPGYRGQSTPGQGPRGQATGTPRRDQPPRGPASAEPRPERLSLSVRPQETRPKEARPHQATRTPATHTPAARTQGTRTQPHQDRRHSEAPKGTVWLYGIHAVTAALGNPSRRIRRLLLTEDAESAILNRLPQPWPVQAERVDRTRLEQTLGRDAVHQGAGLLTDPLTPPSLAQALERPGPVLVLDQVTDPRNVGAIMRSAAAFGVAAIIAQERNAPDETGALAKAASGALEKIPLFKAVNIARTLVALKAAGLWCIGLDASGPPLSGPALSDRRVALVLGAEGEGMRRLTRETCDALAGIGQSLEMESLNVSAAAAIALYEITRKA